MADDIETIYMEDNRAARIILKKSVYEPRPWDWSNGVKWNTDRLQAWEPLYTRKDLSRHLSAQFDFRDLKSQALDVLHAATSALNEVRETVRSIFCAHLLDGQEVFTIQAKDAAQPRIDWYLLVHSPVLISPLGSPMLLVTANDHRLAQKLVDQGRLDQQLASSDFERIFSPCAAFHNSPVYTIFTQSDEEVELFRYLLRLHASMILPTAWPGESLPGGKDSPWLSTYISPLYVDQVVLLHLSLFFLAGTQ